MKDEQTMKRPPVVVVMGHVDHGKTTILDYIKKSNVAEKETGGITQHIGAYQIIHADKVMTFLDTPGHEAFSEMRRRGAHVADLAVLVVAADEGIKPQTLEAAKRITEAELPYVVALNKVDKPNADVNRVKKELSENDILIEEWGGKIPALEVSAKTGQGIPELLDMLALMWEVEEHADAPSDAAQGVVIESRLDPQRGSTATILVTAGTLQKGDVLLCPQTFGKARILEDFAGKEISGAPVSTPVLVIGLEEVPTLGDVCRVVSSVEEARLAVAAAKQEEREKTITMTMTGAGKEEEGAKKILALILKTDVKGSEEAIMDALKNIQHAEVGLKIIASGVGEITEDDIKSAEATGAVAVGFRVDFPKAVEHYARQRGVSVLRYDLIYECLMGIRKELAALLPAEIVKKPLGKVTLLAIFKREKDGLIIGGRVSSGKAVRGAWCDIVRGGKIVSEGKIRELKIAKENAEEVSQGQECGMLYVGKGETPEKGDMVEVYEREEKRREL